MREGSFVKNLRALVAVGLTDAYYCLMQLRYGSNSNAPWAEKSRRTKKISTSNCANLDTPSARLNHWKKLSMCSSTSESMWWIVYRRESKNGPRVPIDGVFAEDYLQALQKALKRNACKPKEKLELADTPVGSTSQARAVGLYRTRNAQMNELIDALNHCGFAIEHVA